MLEQTFQQLLKVVVKSHYCFGSCSTYHRLAILSGLAVVKNFGVAQRETDVQQTSERSSTSDKIHTLYFSCSFPGVTIPFHQGSDET